MVLSFEQATTWIIAGSTAGAFGAASVAAWKAGKLLGIEQDRDRQSSKIAAWIVGRSSASSGFDGLSSSPFAEPVVIAVVANPSDQPIYQVKIEWVSTNSEPTGDSTFLSRPLGKAERDLIPPRDHWEHFLEEKELGELPENSGINAIHRSNFDAEQSAQRIAETLRVSLSFLDSGGQHWKRLIDGSLVRNKGGDLPRTRF